MFLHCFSQRHVSALLRFDHFFLCKANHTISNGIANCMVCLAKKKVVNLKMANHTISNGIVNCMVCLAKKKVVNLKMANHTISNGIANFQMTTR